MRSSMSFFLSFGAAAIFLILGCPGAEGQITGSGPCPVISTPVLNSTFLGRTWYEIFRYPSAMESNLTCVTHTQTFLYIQYILTIEGIESWTGRKLSISGAMIAENPSDLGRWSLSFRGPTPELSYAQYQLPENYFILGLKSTSMVAWACKNYGRYHEKYMWVLTTAKHPSTSTIEEALSVLDDYGIERTDYERVPQSYC